MTPTRTRIASFLRRLAERLEPGTFEESPPLVQVFVRESDTGISEGFAVRACALEESDELGGPYQPVGVRGARKRYVRARPNVVHPPTSPKLGTCTGCRAPLNFPGNGICAACVSSELLPLLRAPPPRPRHRGDSWMEDVDEDGTLRKLVNVDVPISEIPAETLERASIVMAGLEGLTGNSVGIPALLPNGWIVSLYFDPHSTPPRLTHARRTEWQDVPRPESPRARPRHVEEPIDLATLPDGVLRKAHAQGLEESVGYYGSHLAFPAWFHGDMIWLKWDMEARKIVSAHRLVPAPASSETAVKP